MNTFIWIRFYKSFDSSKKLSYEWDEIVHKEKYFFAKTEVYNIRLKVPWRFLSMYVFLEL